MLLRGAREVSRSIHGFICVWSLGIPHAILLLSRGRGFNPNLGGERFAAKVHATRGKKTHRRLSRSTICFWLVVTRSCEISIWLWVTKHPLMFLRTSAVWHRRAHMRNVDMIFYFSAFFKSCSYCNIYVLWKNNFRKQLRLRIFEFQVAVILKLAH